MKTIDIIGVPINLGCNRLGVEEGCDYIRKEVQVLKDRYKVNDLGNLKCPSISELGVDTSATKNIREIMPVCVRLADMVQDSLRHGHFPLILGGDHSLSWGSITGVSQNKPNVGVIYIDAHGDINTEYTTESGNVHGMHLAFLLGYGKVDYVNLYSEGRKVKPENIFFIGTRSLDKGEREIVDNNQLFVRSTDIIKKRGASIIAEEVIKEMESRGITEVHLSLDIDVIDPTIAPGTGVPVSCGLNIQEIKDILSIFLKSRKIISMDLVEYNPSLDVDSKTHEVIKILLSVLNNTL